MTGGRCKGTITVFLSLVSVLFLSLACTLVESARVQGARAWATAVMDMGLFSVFSEYEKELFENYDVFCLDGTYGTGDFQTERMALQMRGFMEYNIEPDKDLTFVRSWNLFPMKLTNCEIMGYTLATDEKGEAFYQQAVGNRMENLPGEILLKYQKNSQEAEKQQREGEKYEKEENLNQEQIKTLGEQQQEIERQEETESPDLEQEPEGAGEAEKEKPENPLEEIEKIKNLGILGLVMKEGSQVSDQRIPLAGTVSKRELLKGNIPVKKEHKGAVADGIFQEYLLDHFTNVRRPGNQGGLSYQMEYILIGKESDVENLKSVVHRLLLLREGTNFLCVSQSGKMRGQAAALAGAIAGAAPVPGLVQALEWALLLAWAYGESLMDVRTMLAGGKVPMVKNEADWKLSLENLGRLSEVLKECDQGGGQGMSYVDYLRILAVVCGKEEYPLRALDMLEYELKGKGRNIQADSWVLRIRARTAWNFPAVFLRPAQVFMGLADQGTDYEVTGNFGY